MLGGSGICPPGLRCLIPRFDGAILSEALWGRYVTGAPRGSHGAVIAAPSRPPVIAIEPFIAKLVGDAAFTDEMKKYMRRGDGELLSVYLIPESKLDEL